MYHYLATMSNPYESVIKMDIHRTFSENPFFKYKKYDGEETLLSVLRAYANFNKELGYTQGMNFVAAALLIILHLETYQEEQAEYFEKYSENYEEKVFWILVHILHEKNWRSMFRDGTPKAFEMLKYFERELSIHAPEIYSKIAETNLTVSLLFYEMFVTLFLLNTPLVIGKRILDNFLIGNIFAGFLTLITKTEGEAILFRVLLRALILSKDKILNFKHGEDLNNYVRKQMFSELNQKHKKRLHILFPSTEEEIDSI